MLLYRKTIARLAAVCFAAAAGLMMLAALSGPAPAAVHRSGVMGVSSQDQAFLNAAAQANIAEIAISQNVEMRVAEPLNALAATYISDHTKALAGLRQLAAGLSVTVPVTATAAQQAEAAQIESQSGHALAVAFAQASVVAHQQAIALFQQEASAGSNVQAISAANAAMPTLKMHLSMAQQDAAQLGVPVTKMPQGAPATGGGGTTGVQQAWLFAIGGMLLLAGLGLSLTLRRPLIPANG